jgi:hypothetical protein
MNRSPDPRVQNSQQPLPKLFPWSKVDLRWNSPRTWNKRLYATSMMKFHRQTLDVTYIEYTAYTGFQLCTPRMAAVYRPRGPSPRSPTNPPVNRSSIADTSRRDRARSFGEWASYGGAFNQMERSPFPEPVALFYCSAFQSADPLFAWHSEMSVCRGSRKPQDVLLDLLARSGASSLVRNWEGYPRSRYLGLGPYVSLPQRCCSI